MSVQNTLSNALVVKRLLKERTTTEVVPDLQPYMPTWNQLTHADQGRIYTPETDIQLTGSSWLVRTPVGILGDVQGQGKTKMVYDAIDYLMQHEIGNALIICKAGNIDDTWIADWKFMRPDTAILIDYRGTVKQREKLLTELGPNGGGKFDYNNVIVIMSYAMYRQDWQAVHRLPWDLVVLDESPYIGGTGLNGEPSEISQRIMALSNVPRRWLLSGTPIKKHVGTLWNQLRFLGLEKRQWPQFEAEVLQVREVQIAPKKFRKQVTGVKSDLVLKWIAECLNMIMLRRTDQSHLPPKMPTKRILVTMTADNTAKYIALQKQLRQAEATVSEKYSKPDVYKMQMREFCSNLPEKFDAAQEIADEAIDAGDKTIIFTKHVDTMRALYTRFKSYGIAYILGSISTSRRSDGGSDRSAQVKKFQTDPECKVLLATTGASSEGLPLFAANHVIFIDRPDSKGDFEQALARPHRIGQTKPLFSYVLEAVYNSGGKVCNTIEHSVDGKYAREGRVTEQVGL